METRKIIFDSEKERLEYLIKFVHALSSARDANISKDFQEARKEIQKILGLPKQF